MSNRILIKSDFPSKQEKELVRQICKREGVNKAYVKMLQRFGYSGAKIIILYFNEKPENSLPFIVKKAKLEKITQEFNAISSLSSKIRDSKLHINEVFKTEDEEWGALIYDFWGSDKCDDSKSLREIVYDFDNFSDDDILEVFNMILMKLNNAHNSAIWQDVSFEKYYLDYLRENKEYSDIRINSIFGSKAGLKKFNFLHTSIYNPLQYLKNIPSTISVPLGTIHGDLHLDNVVINIDSKIPVPHLIDFAWASLSGDVLIDFVLLENSLRYKCFPKKENLQEQLQIENYYLDNDIEAIYKLDFSSKEKKMLYNRQAKIIKLIRKQAFSILNGELTLERYLLTQFIVLYGLMRYEDSYCSYVPLRNLGLIALKLMDKNFLDVKT